MPELIQKQVAFAILKWLKAQKDEAGNLTPALDCLAAHFEVNLDDAECHNQCDTGLKLDEAVYAISAKSGEPDAVKEQKLQVS